MIHTDHHRCTHIPAHSAQQLCAPGEIAISRWRLAAMGWPSRAEQMSRTCVRSCSSLTSPSAGSQTGGNPSCLPPRPLSSSGGPPCLLPCLPSFPAPLHYLSLTAQNLPMVLRSLTVPSTCSKPPPPLQAAACTVGIL